MLFFPLWTDIWELGNTGNSVPYQEDPLEEEGMATHSSILAGKAHAQRSLQGYSPKSQRVRHDLETKKQPFHLDTPCGFCLKNQFFWMLTPSHLFACKLPFFSK